MRTYTVDKQMINGGVARLYDVAKRVQRISVDDCKNIERQIDQIEDLFDEIDETGELRESARELTYSVIAETGRQAQGIYPIVHAGVIGEVARIILGDDSYGANTILER